MAAATDTATDTKRDAKPGESAGAKGAASAGSRSRSRNKTTPPVAPVKRSMSDEHKQALHQGRSEGKAVNEYLAALEAHKPKRGRKVTPEQLKERIRVLEEETIPSASGGDKLLAIQAKIDLEARLRQAEDTTVITELQEKFVKVAKSYGERRGISYDAYRVFGVPPAVLKEAGVVRRSA